MKLFGIINETFVCQKITPSLTLPFTACCYCSRAITLEVNKYQVLTLTNTKHRIINYINYRSQCSKIREINHCGGGTFEH